MDIFNGVIAVFDFIYSVLNTIINGISGITSILFNVINLVFSIIRILPVQLYVITLAYVSVLYVIYLFKLIRKG